MKRLALITMSRAEYGLILPVLRELRKNEGKDLRVDLVVSGTHLSETYGLTVREIEKDGERIDHRVDVSVRSETEQDIASVYSDVLKSFTDLFCKERYDAILILGDRYEMMAVAVAAGITCTPVFHMCGGDTTEGAIDEWIRHSITKISYLHFVTNEVSRKRVIEMGEAPERVFNYGSTGIDNIRTQPNRSRREALSSIGLEDCEYALCTYHPVTMEGEKMQAQIKALLDVIKEMPEITFIVTKANADQQGEAINRLLSATEAGIENMHLFSSLGSKRYIALMKHSSFVLGNSSSGILEAPACGVPTVNIGNRQKGRLRADSVVDCGPEKEEILSAIRRVCTDEFQRISKRANSPYGDGNASKRIAETCIKTIQEGTIDLRKRFYDCCEGI